MGTSWRHRRGNFSAGSGWQLNPWKCCCRGHLCPEAVRSLNRDRCWSKAAPGSAAQPGWHLATACELTSNSQKSQSCSFCPLAHASLCFQPRCITETTNIEGIVKGNVSCSCFLKHCVPSPSLPAGFASSRLRLHVEFKNTQHQNSAGSSRPAQASEALACPSLGGQTPATTTAAFYLPVLAMPNWGIIPRASHSGARHVLV